MLRTLQLARAVNDDELSKESRDALATPKRKPNSDASGPEDRDAFVADEADVELQQSEQRELMAQRGH